MTTHTNTITHRSRNRITAFVAAFAFALALLPIAPASAAPTSSSLGLGDSRPSQTGQYTLTTSNLSTATIGCIEVDLGTAADGTGSITGLDTSAATFVSQTISGSGTWTASNTASADHKLRFVNGTPTAGSATAARTAVWGGVVNGSVADTSYFAKFTTYTTNTCTTPVDTSTVQFVYTAGQAVSLSVDPSLTFTVAGTASATSCNGATSNVTTTATTIPFGAVTSSANKIAVQNLTVTTNAGSGYSVFSRYTAKPTSGANDIDDHTGTNAAPTAFSAAGTEAFGYTTNDATLGTGTANRFTSTPNVWSAFTTSNLEVAYSSAGVANETTCVGHQVGIGGTTPAGSYTTTVVYTATPVY